MKKIVPIWVFLSALILVPWSSVAYAQGADELVRETTNRVMKHIREHRAVLQADPSRVYSLVSEEILPYFDFVKMSQWVLGKYWHRATSEQQVQFSDEFRTLLVKTYAKALLEYSSGGVKVLPSRGDDTPQRTTVRTEVRQAGGFPIPINYSMYQDGDSWRVFDVTIDGISLVSNYRTAFASRISQMGLEKLISMLVERNGSVQQ